MRLSNITNRLPAAALGIILGLAVGYTPISQAADLAGAFNGLLDGASIHTTKPGNYQSQARNSYVLGGARIRFPRSTVQLFSITPPSISAGCNGIDFMFGGFSFISGEQFSAMIRNIAQVSLGNVVYLALKQLCPTCQAVIEVLQSAAQLAQKAAIDSCKAGEAIANKIGNSLGWDTSKANEGSSQACAAESSEKGATDSFLSAQSVLDGICGGISKATKWLEDLAKSDPKEAEKLADVVGNTTWIALMAVGFDKEPALAEIMMTMTGYSVRRSSKENGETETKSRPEGLVVDKLMGVFMCGTRMLYGNNPPSTGFPAGDAYCYDKIDGQTITIYECDNLERCEYPEAKPIASWSRIDDFGAMDGFLYHIYYLLKSSIDKVKTNQALSPREIQFIQSAPLPLYKAINLAAVYPYAAEQLVDNNALMLAYLYADAYFRHLVEEVKKNAEATDVSSDIIKALLEMQATMFEKQAVELQFIDNMLARQDIFLKQIHRIEAIMQNTIWSRGMMNNQLFTKYVQDGVSP